jgi:hypothetical protein
MRDGDTTKAANPTTGRSKREWSKRLTPWKMVTTDPAVTTTIIKIHLGLQQSLTTKNHFYRNRQTEFSNIIEDSDFVGREAKYSLFFLFQARTRQTLFCTLLIHFPRSYKRMIN